MEAMLASVTPRLRTGARMISVSLHVDAPEGTIAPHLSETQNAFSDVKMGSYPYFGETSPGVYLVLRAVDPDRLETACRALEARLGAAGLPHERKSPDTA
jgi:molybdopterin-biosynthesis enzyme MoeA-like protein